MDFIQIPVLRPPTKWTLPNWRDLPDWSRYDRMGLDIESRDPNLTKLGPGFRRDAYNIGVALAFPDGKKFYLPMRHATGRNMEVGKVLKYLREQAASYRGEVIGANFNYDVDGLYSDGVEFHRDAKLRDVQIAEALLYELHDRYSLEHCAGYNGLKAKDDALLYEAAKAYSLRKKSKPSEVDHKGQMFKLPPEYVGPYAEQDAMLGLQIYDAQKPRLDEQNLWQIWNLETELLPVLIRMRRRGVLVDQGYMEYIQKRCLRYRDKYLRAFTNLTGYHITPEIMRSKGMAEICQSLGMPIGVSAKGNPILDKFAFIAHGTPWAKAILAAKQVDTATTAVTSLFKHITSQGRVHTTFNQVKGEKFSGDDSGGAAFGRTSSVNPNLQNQSNQIPDFRRIFLPDPGCQWACIDYSSQEVKLAVHYAELIGARGAAQIGDALRENPHIDFHGMVAEIAGIKRSEAKIWLFSRLYGKGDGRLVSELGFATTKRLNKRTGRVFEEPGREGQLFLDKFARRLPFIDDLIRQAKVNATQRGQVRTLLGRLCRFPARVNGKGYDFAHKALNRIIQGSAGDQMKQALVDCDRAGIPLQLSVHDEIDLSVPDLEMAREVSRIMIDAVKLTVPVTTDIEVGPNWKDIKKAAA